MHCRANIQAAQAVAIKPVYYNTSEKKQEMNNKVHVATNEKNSSNL